MKENNKKNISKDKKKVVLLLNVLMTTFLVICVTALLYPFISNYISRQEIIKNVSSYDTGVSNMVEEDKERILKKANEYNQSLIDSPSGFDLSEEQLEEYYDVLDISGDRKRGVMGHIEIPDIGVSLIIYHTVDNAVLSAGVGHMPGSSVPVGGKGTHSVLSGHRGLTSATLFTNLDKMEVGDIFYITIFDNKLAYKVYDIEVVLPTEMDSLRIDPNDDLCTLITCTPYGVNSHRILVHGRRTEYVEVETENRAAFGLAEYLAIAGVVILFLIALYILIKQRRKKNEEKLV